MGWIDTWLLPLGGVLLGGVGMVVLVLGLFGRWFRARGRAGRVRSCRRCRFDLSATEGHTCPECGHTARYEAEHYAGRCRWPVAALGLLLLIGAVGLVMTPGVKRDGWLHLLPMWVQTRVFHLETNSNSFWMFSERLEGRQPTGGPGAFAISLHNDDVDETVEAWRYQAASTAAHVMTRASARPVLQLDRAQTILSRFGHGLLDLSVLDQIVGIHGLTFERVRELVARWPGEPTQTLREARRSLLQYDEHRDPVARIIAQSSLEPEDAILLGAFLAHAGSGLYGGSSRVQFLGAQPPEAVWLAYAAEVRAGRIGSTGTLVDGATANAEVAAAAIGHIAALPSGNAPKVHADALLEADLADGLGVHLDREHIGIALQSGRNFDDRRELVRLINRHDELAARWYIDLARDPGSPLRNQAVVELGRVRHDRGRAFAFWSAEAWPDESLGLHHRMAALFSMRSWDRSEHAELAPFWEQVLQRAADADPLAIEQGLARFTGPGLPPTTDAIIAVARRLAANGTSEDWLVDLAGHMASRWGRDHSLKGLVELLEDRRAWTLADAAWYRNEIESLTATVKALVQDEPDSPAREP